MKKVFSVLILTTLALGMLAQHDNARAQNGTPITTDGMINAYNNMRIARGLAPMAVDPILMQTAQETADLMALYHMMDHMGNVRGRVMAAGFGGGETSWATENWAMGATSLEQLLQFWADDAHMIPAVNYRYTHVGAGIATYNGSTYYIMHAAYTSGGTYQVTPTSASATQDPGRLATLYVSQIIYPVQTSTPNPAGGPYVHEVRSGQALWSIAIAYDTHIIDLQRINGMTTEDTTIWIGQKLYLPTPQIAPDLLDATQTAQAMPVNPSPTLAEMNASPAAAQATPAAPAATGAATATPGPTITRLAPGATPTASPTAAPAASETTPASAPQERSGNNVLAYVMIGIAGLGLLLILLGVTVKK